MTAPRTPQAIAYAEHRRKKKYRAFRYGQIVRCGFHFGHVLSTDSGVEVRFPEPNENSYKDINFHPNGTLLGKGEVVLFHADQPKGLDEVCREMSRKLEDADKRMREIKDRQIRSIMDPIEEDDLEHGDGF